MGYAKGTTSISETRDVPLLVSVRNARFISHSQLFELMQALAIEFSRESFIWRVRRLVVAGYLSRLEGDFGNGAIVYRIARRGLIQLESHGQYSVVLNSETAHLPHPSHAYHALELNAVRLALLRKSVLLNWKSDVEIASDNTVSAAPLAKDYDAVVDVWNGDRAARFGLEYERTIKSAHQYERIRLALESEDVLPAILYLTSGDKITEHLAQQLAGIPRRLAFATARAFRESLLDTPVLTYPGDPLVPFRSQLGGMF